MIADDTAILHDRLDGIGVGGLPGLFCENYWGAQHAGGLYRPLSLSGLVLQKLLCDNAMWSYRLVSLAMHAACPVKV